MESITASEIFGILFTGINNVVQWFQDYILVGDWKYIIYGFIFFAIFARLILAPLFGASSFYGGSSDSVSSSPYKSSNFGSAVPGYIDPSDDPVYIVDDTIPRIGGKL